MIRFSGWAERVKAGLMIDKVLNIVKKSVTQQYLQALKEPLFILQPAYPFFHL